MSPTAVSQLQEVTEGWLAAVRGADVGTGINVDLWFECLDDEPWTHVCRIRDGRPVDWVPDQSTRPCIGHTRGLMGEALRGGAGILDPRWQFVPRHRHRPRSLPPHDLVDLEVDVSELGLPESTSVSWLTRCRTPSGEEVGYRSDLVEGRVVTHSLHVAGATPPDTVLTLAVADHLRLRSGGEVMAAFDHGGVDGSIDELIFLAGLFDSAAWRSRTSLPDAAVWRIHDHVRLFSSLCTAEVDA